MEITNADTYNSKYQDSYLNGVRLKKVSKCIVKLFYNTFEPMLYLSSKLKYFNLETKKQF